MAVSRHHSQTPVLRWTELPEFTTLPEEWELVALGAVVQVTAGQSPDGDSCNNQGRGLPFLQGNAEFGDLHPTPKQWCASAKKKCLSSDILISVRAPVGEMNKADQVYAIGRGLAALTPLGMDADYLYQGMLRWRQCLQRVGQGTTFDAVTARHFEQMRVPLPLVREQVAIAHILDSVDRAIEAARIAIEKAQRVKKALMQRLLPPWIGFKRLDGQVLENGCVVRCSSEVARIANGSTPSRDERTYWSGGTIPWLATGKVNERVITCADEFVTDKALSECSIEVMSAGTVLVAMIGQGKTRGMAAFLACDACINQNFGAFVPKGELNGKYLFHYLDHHYMALREIGCGTNQGALNCYMLKRIRLPIPDLSLQDNIVSQLDACDNVVTKHEMMVANLSRLKRGLTQDLLTGKVRTVKADTITQPAASREPVGTGS